MVDAVNTDDAVGVRDAAKQIEGLLSDDGHVNSNPDRLSRGHPDYVEGEDDTARSGSQDRDERGRFKSRKADDSASHEDDDEDFDDKNFEDTGDSEQESDEDGEASEDERSADDNDDGDDSGETDELHTLGDIAEALEISLDDLKASIKHSFKASGEEVSVTLAELEAGYQKDADYRRNSSKLANDIREKEAEFTARAQEYERASTLNAGLLTYVENMFTQQLNDPGLEQLRQSDPVEWVARREELSNTLGTLQRVRQEAAQNYEVFRQKQLLETRSREQNALVSKIPEFGEAHRKLALETLTSLGFGGNEALQVLDHRLIVGALELAALREETEKLRKTVSDAEGASQRVRKNMPKKMQSPGKKRSSGSKSRKTDLSKLQARAKKSGTVGDAAKVIENFI